ncbi:MAG: RNA polymerase sigma factor [Planctomycetota bacterium]
MQSDSELVKAVLDGEKDAFEVLVKRYERPVRAVALNMLKEYHNAADVVQDTFVRAYENLPKLRNSGAFGPWLMKITRRCALTSLRQNPRQAALKEAIASTVEKPDSQLDDERQRLLWAVMKLPQAQRQVVMLRYFADNSVKDAARISGRSTGTVTKQLSRAHKRLRKILEVSEK